MRSLNSDKIISWAKIVSVELGREEDYESAHSVDHMLECGQIEGLVAVMLCSVVRLVPWQASPGRPRGERFSCPMGPVPEWHPDLIRGKPVTYVDLLIVSHIHVVLLCVTVLCQDGLTIRFDLNTSTKQ